MVAFAQGSSAGGSDVEVVEVGGGRVVDVEVGARPFEARARGDLALLISRHPALTSDLGPVADIVAPAVVIARAVGMQALLDDLVRKTREPGRGQPVTSNTATT
jgi:hypothetical protein